MNRQSINQTYYQKNQAKLQEKRRLNYQKQKQPTTKQKPLADYYRANNIQILFSLKDYVESSPPKRKL